MKVVEQLLFREPTDSSVSVIKTVVLDVVQFAEDAELRELRDAGEEDKAQQSLVGL